MKNKNRMNIGFPRIKNLVADKIIGIVAVAAIFICLSFVTSLKQTKEIDILFKGGTVIDPKNKINSKMDVAVVGNKIFKVAANIPASTAKKVVDVTGLYVTPGLIDIHTHVFVGSTASRFADGPSSVKPDDFAPRAGITTVVDAGTSGWRNFPKFKEQVIDRSKTRVLAFLNAFGSGMIGAGAEEDLNDMDPAMTADIIKKYPETIVGIKVGHYRGTDWTPIDRAVAAARASNIPLLMECNLGNLSFEGKLSRMGAGDIYTHALNRETLDTVTKKIKPFVLEARKRGVLFDIGHGASGFRFSQALPASKLGFFPNSFGTDLHYNSVNSGMKDMLNVMSKYLNMGMSLQDVVQTASWGTANIIKRPDLGQLSVGAVADIAVLRVRDGKFGFVDSGGFKIEGNRKLETEMTIRNGSVIWDLNGLSAQKVP